MADRTHSHDTATPALSVEIAAGISIEALQAAHVARQEEWCPNQKPDLSFRGNEMAGEVGEACNVIKKLERERQGWRGSRATVDDLGDELADVIHTAILCSITAGIELGPRVVAKFNVTSEKNGLATTLAATPAPSPSPAAKGGVNWTVNDLAEGLAALHGEGVSDDYREKADHLLAHLSFCASAACAPAAKGGEAEAVKAILEWYSRTVENCRKLTSDGNAAREALDRDGGSRAKEALAKIAALAAPSPQPANAVRELLREVESETPPDDQPRDGQGAYVYMTWETIDALRAALASDPAPAGEAVEPVAWGVWNGEFYETGPDEATMRYRHEPTRKVVPLYTHPAPEDTARLREDLAEAVRQIEANIAAIERSKEFVQKATALTQTAELERDDARKALETAAEDERDRLLEELLNSCMGPTAMDAINRFLREHGAMFLEDRAAARSASREDTRE